MARESLLTMRGPAFRAWRDEDGRWSVVAGDGLVGYECRTRGKGFDTWQEAEQWLWEQYAKLYGLEQGSIH